MKKWFKISALSGLFLFFIGCGHLAYLGIHGKSIKSSPDIHQSAVTDEQCLECHHPDSEEEGPASPHPHFKGCLKCHND
ncbi:MAG: hypothetical protein GY797_05930 [Deltaproteobacteria bacterium]|nr:hypothetical protein [Deltaproteobacteria bacterium]